VGARIQASLTWVAPAAAGIAADVAKPSINPAPLRGGFIFPFKA